MKYLDYTGLDPVIKSDDMFINHELINHAYEDRLLEPFLLGKRNIFRIAFEDRTGKIYEPEIPQHRAVGEDGSIARVCFADTVEGCFRAIPGGSKFVQKPSYFDPMVAAAHIYVHVPIFDNFFIRAIKQGFVAYPHTMLVPDAYLTQEIWVMDDVQVECIAEMYAWYDASYNPNFTTLEELPVRLELINYNFDGGKNMDILIDDLFEHPEYTLPMYEM